MKNVFTCSFKFRSRRATVFVFIVAAFCLAASVAFAAAVAATAEAPAETTSGNNAKVITETAVAASNDWKINGNWCYSANIPKTKVTIPDVGEVEIEVYSLGNVIVNAPTASDGKEYFADTDALKINYYYGMTITKNGATECKKPEGGTDSFDAVDIGKQGEAYVPGETITINDTVEVKGIPVPFVLEVKQINADEVAGTATLKIGEQVLKGTVTGYRPDSSWRIGGTWDYKLNLSANKIKLVETVYDFTVDEHGLNTTTTTIKDGIEYINKIVMDYVCTWTATTGTEKRGDTRKGTNSVEVGAKPYIPGELIDCVTKLPGTELDKNTKYLRMGFVVRQTEKDKVDGKVYLLKVNDKEEIIEYLGSGDISATRHENSSTSGCNAGFGAFALLAVTGLFVVHRKK